MAYSTVPPHQQFGFEDQLYSYRSATTGSNRAALFAGQIPKNNPTATDTTTPSTAAQIGTAVGSLGKTIREISEIIHPTDMPIRPPSPVSTIASVRNCRTISDRRA